MACFDVFFIIIPVRYVPQFKFFQFCLFNKIMPRNYCKVMEVV